MPVYTKILLISTQNLEKYRKRKKSSESNLFSHFSHLNILWLGGLELGGGLVWFRVFYAVKTLLLSLQLGPIKYF